MAAFASDFFLFSCSFFLFSSCFFRSKFTFCCCSLISFDTIGLYKSSNFLDKRVAMTLTPLLISVRREEESDC